VATSFRLDVCVILRRLSRTPPAYAKAHCLLVGDCAVTGRHSESALRSVSRLYLDHGARCTGQQDYGRMVLSQTEAERRRLAEIAVGGGAKFPS
jgi:hypothetical protein